MYQTRRKRYGAIGEVTRQNAYGSLKGSKGGRASLSSLRDDIIRQGRFVDEDDIIGEDIDRW